MTTSTPVIPSLNTDSVVDARRADQVTSPITVRKTAFLDTPDARFVSFTSRWWIGPLMIGIETIGLQVLVMSAVLASQVVLGVGWALWPIFALEAMSIIVGNALMKLYPGYGFGPVEHFRRRIKLSLYFCAMLTFCHAILVPTLPMLVLPGLIAALALIVLPTVRTLTTHYLIKAGVWGCPVVVVGACATGRTLVHTLTENPHQGFVPIAILDDDPLNWRRQIGGVPVSGPLSHARLLSRRARVALVTSGQMKNTANVERMMRRLPFPTVIVLPAQLGITALQTTGCDLGGMLGLHFTNNFRLRSRWHAKRALDYALTIPTFLCSLPLLVFFAAWIKLVSPGPVFYAQTRIGLGGKRFRMWKLRTMHTDAEQRLQQLLENDPESREEWERYCKLKRDPRVIPGIGQFLRKSSIDELPQLWNVLRGDMSLVGPRPLPDYHLDRFSTEFRALRRQVLPGLTGMWQVLARNAGDLPVQEACDTYYITNWSGWLDLYLLGQTLHAVLTRRSAY